MPLTPFHLGPALLIALLLFPTLDLASFLVSSVIVDVEPFYLMSQPVPYLHGFFHSYLGASIFGVLVAVVMYSIRGVSQRILGLFLVQQKSSFWRILFTSLLGVYSHVFLDSFLYRDIKPLYPLDFNPLLNAISTHSVYEFCSISFLLGLIVYTYRAVKAWRSSRSMGQIRGPMKMLIIIIVILVVAAFGLGLLMSLPFFGEPKLRVNLASSPLREVSPGDTFEMDIEIINEGGGELRNLVIRLDMPEGFISSVTGTNTRTVGPSYLSAHDGFGQVFTVTVSKDISPGSYGLTITVTADNVPPHILSPTIIVVKE